MGMTNKEAIDILEHARLMSGFPAQIKFTFDAEGIEALEMAIKALKIIQSIEDVYMDELLRTPDERGVKLSDRKYDK